STFFSHTPTPPVLSSLSLHDALPIWIDWILIADPDTTTEWIAVEIQSVYFSGGNMDVDFQKYVQKPQKLNVTDTNRRPDWRSSGAKRLAPQLAAKSPVMAQWGKKRSEE